MCKKLFNLAHFKGLLILALLCMVGNVWGTDLSGGATFDLKSSSYSTAKVTVSGSSSTGKLTASGTSYYYYSTASKTFTLDLFDGLTFTSGSTAGSTRFYPSYGFYCGQNASKITIDGSGLTAGQKISVTFMSSSSSTAAGIAVTNMTTTATTTTTKNTDLTLDYTVTTAGTNITIGRSNQSCYVSKIVIDGVSSDPTIAMDENVDLGAITATSSASKEVSVAFNNFTETINASAELSGAGASAFTISPTTLAENGTVTVSKNTTTPGTYEATLTVKQNDDLKATATIKMTIVDGIMKMSGDEDAGIKFVSGSGSTEGAFWVKSTPLKANGITLSGSENSETNISYYDGSLVRFYKNNTFTLTPANGVTIKRVEIIRSTATSSNGGTITCDNLTASTDNTTTNTNVFTGSATSAVTFTASSSQCRFTKILVYYVGEEIVVPIINAENVEIASDATSGEIEYTITNPTAASLTAEKTTGEWISNVAVDATNKKVTFSATANTATTSREGTITLKYTDADDKIITVTQAANVAPEIEASNVNIDADATSGEIEYEISNAKTGATLSASSTATWLSNFVTDADNSKVSFSAEENTSTSETREATITLTYKASDGTTVFATKDVTVTQAKAIAYTTYDKVSASSMVIGGTYVWYAEKSDGLSKSVATAKGSNTFFGAATLVTNSKVTDTQLKLTTETPQQFIFSQKTASDWTIADAGTPTNYLYVSGDKKIAWGTTENVWTLSGTNAPAFSCSTYNSTAYTMFANLGSTRFNAYTASGTSTQTAYLYHLASEETSTLTLDMNYTEGDAEVTKAYILKNSYAWIPIEPVRTGYVFQGWAESADGDVVISKTTGTVSLTDNKTYFAKWEEQTADPSVEITGAPVAVTSNRSMTGTATFTVTGSNITSDINLALASDVDGLTISPETIAVADAATEQTITVTYTSESAIAATDVNINITSGGTNLGTAKVTYSSTAPLTAITNVSEEKTWDFTGYTTDVLCDNTGAEYILGNLAEFNTGFDADALKGMQQYIVRKNYCWQGTQLTFHPTVAGTVTVVWSSTGSSKRTLAIGDEKIVPAGVTGGSAKQTTIRNVSADADVVLTGWNVADDGAYTSNQVRVWSVKFTPTTYSDAQLTMSFYTKDKQGNPDKYYATFSDADNDVFVPEYDANLTSAAIVYKVSVAGTTMSMIELSKVAGKGGENGYFIPKNTGVLIKVEFDGNDSKTIPYYTVSNRVIDALTDNMMYAGTGAAIVAPTDCKYYKLAYNDYTAKTGLGFYWGATDGAAYTASKGKAYLAVPVSGTTAPIHFVFDEIPAVDSGVQTGLDELNAQAENGKFILNGKLYIRHNGQVFDAAGALVK